MFGKGRLPRVRCRKWSSISRSPDSMESISIVLVIRIRARHWNQSCRVSLEQLQLRVTAAGWRSSVSLTTTTAYVTSTQKRNARKTRTRDSHFDYFVGRWLFRPGTLSWKNVALVFFRRHVGSLQHFSARTAGCNEYVVFHGIRRAV